MKRWREESWQCSYCGDDGCVQGKYEEVEPSGFVCLHNVQHKGTWQILCTNCVLMSHPGLFCPICLQTFEPSSTPPPVGHRLMCLKCPSIAHLSCSSSSSFSSASASSSSFLCPPCTCNSHFRFFSNGNGFFDRDNAKALVTAATIASFSMNKAAIAARADAERLLKEALAAKQRAKEALELLAHLVAIDNQKNKNKNKGKNASTMTTTSLEQD